MNHLLLELIVIALLIAANAVFAGAEIAVISVRESRLRELIESGDRRAARVLELRSNAERFLATVQVGITLVSALAAALGGATLASPLARLLSRVFGLAASADGIALGVVVLGISFCSIVAGELVPKSLALRYSESLALALALPLTWLARMTQPLVWLLTASANLILKPLGDRTKFSETRLTVEEIRVMIGEAKNSGGIERPLAEIIERSVDFGELTAADVQVPRNRIVAIASDSPTAEIRRVLLEEGMNRMPVYRGDLDDIVGYVSSKDVVSLIWEKELIVLADIVRPAFFVPANMRALDLMRALQRRREHLAIVVDEYGSTTGLCTMEDLVEEIVGEIFSETSTEPDPVAHESDGVALIVAVLPIRDFNREFAAKLPEDDGYDTVAGLLAQLAGTIPRAGQRFVAYGFEFTVVSASERRVDRVRVRRLGRQETRSHQAALD